MKSLKATLKLGSSSNRYAPRLPQQETKSSTKQLAPTDPILGPEKLLKTGFAQKGLPSTAATWADSEPAIGQISSPSYEVKDGDICRAVAAIADLPSSTLPDSPFILALGTPAAQNVPPQTGTSAQRALDKWERTLCENKALRSLRRCKPADRPSSKKMAAKCLLLLSLTGHLRTPRH